MILRELLVIHEEYQRDVDEMERDGTATAYPEDYRKAIERAEFYMASAMHYQRLKETFGDGPLGRYL